MFSILGNKIVKKCVLKIKTGFSISSL